MASQRIFLDFLLREWLLLSSVAGLIVTSFSLHRFPRYSRGDAEIIAVLAALFVAVKGLERSGVMTWVSRRIERGGFLAVKLVVTTFALSMIVTNDVALVVIVPLTLTIDTRHKGILVILEALAANAGSALTPIGNPQNLFIYWFYGMEPAVFIRCIAPFSIAFLALFAAAAFFVRTTGGGGARSAPPRIGRRAVPYAVLLLAVILTVLHRLPVETTIVVVLCALFLDRGSLRIDYALLLTLVCFFGISENLRILLGSTLEHSEHIFILSALASQIMSNVPAAVLFADFTSRWPALLWGVNVGGFGSLVGSLANLIAYRLYAAGDGKEDVGRFTARFLAFGYAAFFLGVGLYFGFGPGG